MKLISTLICLVGLNTFGQGISFMGPSSLTSIGLSADQIQAAGGVMNPNNTLIIDNIIGDNTLAATSPYKISWRTAFDLYNTNNLSFAYGALTSSKPGDWIYFKPSSNAYLVPSIPLGMYGVNLYIPRGVTLLRTNFSNTNATGFLTASETTVGPLIIPGNQSISVVDGSIYATNDLINAIYGANAANTYVFITNNANITNSYLGGRGSIYSSYDTIVCGANVTPTGSMTIEDLRIGSDYDCFNIVGNITLTTRNLICLADGTQNQDSRGAVISCPWTDYNSSFTAVSGTDVTAVRTNAGIYLTTFTNYTVYLYGTVTKIVTNSSGTLPAASGALFRSGQGRDGGALVKGNWHEITWTNGVVKAERFVATSHDTETNGIATLNYSITGSAFGVAGANVTWFSNNLTTAAFTNSGTSSRFITNTESSPFTLWVIFVAGTSRYYSTNGPATSSWWITNAATAPAGTTAYNVGVSNYVETLTARSTFTRTNFISGFLYTNNTGGNILVSCRVGLTTAAATAGVSSLALEMLGNETNAFSATTTASTLADNYTNTIYGVVTNGGQYSFTNKSTGSGNLAAPNGGQILLLP